MKNMYSQVCEKKKYKYIENRISYKTNKLISLIFIINQLKLFYYFTKVSYPTLLGTFIFYMNGSAQVNNLNVLLFRAMIIYVIFWKIIIIVVIGLLKFFKENNNIQHTKKKNRILYIPFG